MTALTGKCCVWAVYSSLTKDEARRIAANIVRGFITVAFEKRISINPRMQEPANENLTFGPCPNCGQPLRLGLIEPDEPEHEKRTYQCDLCGYSEIKTVKYR